jgi:two-component system response regulator AtoC
MVDCLPVGYGGRMKLYVIRDHQLVRCWFLSKGTHRLGSGGRSDLILDPRVCPQEELCNLEVTPELVTVTELGEATLRCADGTGFRGLLRCGESLTVGDFQLLAMDEELLPEFLVGEEADEGAPTAESDGVVPPPKQPLVLLLRGERGTQIVPMRKELVVGRIASCAKTGIRLTHPAVSRKHAAIVEEVDGYYLLSLGNHRTFLNGVALEPGERKKLTAPSEIRFTRNTQVPLVEVVSLAELRQAPPQDLVAGAIVGDSLSTQKIRATAMQLGREKISVIIHGETGTGKELAAGLLALEYNPRKPAPTVVDCTTLAATMAEAELFGYVKGAFTDAKAEKKGLVDEAEGGVLFFDEIGDLAPELQAKLLRLIQERGFRRVGGTEYIEANVRFVFATHRDLEQMVRDRKFRKDLYERIKGAVLELAPLRERKEDIGAIATHYLLKREPGPKKTIADAAVAALHGYDWPGNVRELLRVVEIGAIRTPGDGEIAEATVREILTELQGKPAGEAAPEAVRDAPARVEAYEKALCKEGLARNGGNWKKAAEELGYHPSAFYRRMKAWHLLKSDANASVGAA